jgi:hypothetical protein
MQSLKKVLDRLKFQRANKIRGIQKSILIKFPQRESLMR